MDQANDQSIDYLIATTVMGWRYEQIPASVGGNGYFARWYDAEGNRLYSNMVTETSVWGIKWQPSVSIAQAWQVLDKLCTNGCTINVVTINKQEWGCNILEKGELFCGIADTAPRAICAAALKTVRIS